MAKKLTTIFFILTGKKSSFFLCIQIEQSILFRDIVGSCDVLVLEICLEGVILDLD